ncbi:MAG: elongation factor G [Firmicutes bacterium]|jgi:elongation factor G|nr:elongation factor G [Bacillota bacterium]
MKKFATERLRNIGLIAHSGAGKTSLAEAMLYNSGVIDRLGRVEDGTTTTDYDPEEIKRQISINAALAPCPWKEHKINIIDTPGYFDFVGEVKGGLRVSDGAIVVVCAVSGIEVGTEQVWDYANEYELPKMFFINKMDRENANFFKVLDDLRDKFGQNVVPFQLPIGAEANFKGFVDVVDMKAYYFDGKNLTEGEIPGDLKDKIDSYRDMIIEAVAESDDELLMKYLEGEKLTEDEIHSGLRNGVLNGKIVPVLCGSATANKGIQPLMDTIINYLPSPKDTPAVKGVNPKTGEKTERKADDSEPFCALVFKTMADPYVGRLTLFRVYSGVLKSDSTVYNSNKGETEKIGQIYVMHGKKQEAVPEVQAGDLAAVAKLQYTTTSDTLCDKDNPIQLKEIQFPKPVIAAAIQPKAKGDEEKIGSGLSRLAEEDPTFEVTKDTETNQIIIKGMGDVHLEVICSRLSSKFGTEVLLDTPKVPYRETIRSSVKVEGKHKKQSGGRGQYGHVWLELQPLTDSDEEFVFEDKIFGGAVPKQYIPAVEKGLRESLKEGVLAGYPVVNVKAILYDGSYHTVDSSEMAFKIAASMAFKKGALQASPVLLEPIMNVEVVVPEAYMGDIIGDLNKKRGRILGMDPKNGFQVIKAQVPQAEMFKYATDLRSMTQGRGTFTATFSHYEEVPAHISEKIIEEAKKQKQEE